MSQRGSRCCRPGRTEALQAQSLSDPLFVDGSDDGLGNGARRMLGATVLAAIRSPRASSSPTIPPRTVIGIAAFN
ncbi:MAG: hypothetical protein U0Q12_02825 [Vicinamibacterales bacterium]